MEHYYPISLDLKGKKCLVIGGGNVADRKIKTLLSCGASVTVVSPELTPRLQQMAAEATIEHMRGSYEPDYLEGAFLVIGATDNPDTNRMIAEACFSRNILVNVIDAPSLCNFIVPSLLRRGPLSIAISTEGQSPAFARLLREELEQRFSEEYGEFIKYLGELRPLIIEQVPDRQRRKALFLEMAGEGFFNLFKTLPPDQLEQKAKEIISRYYS